MSTTHIKLTEGERTTIVNALTVAARQYEIDAERASELALHGMAIFQPAEIWQSSSRSWRPTLDNCATKSRFFGRHSTLNNRWPPLPSTVGGRRDRRLLHRERSKRPLEGASNAFLRAPPLPSEVDSRRAVESENANKITIADVTARVPGFPAVVEAFGRARTRRTGLGSCGGAKVKEGRLIHEGESR